MLENFRKAAQLAASQEGLISVKWHVTEMNLSKIVASSKFEVSDSPFNKLNLRQRESWLETKEWSYDSAQTGSQHELSCHNSFQSAQNRLTCDDATEDWATNPSGIQWLKSLGHWWMIESLIQLNDTSCWLSCFVFGRLLIQLSARRQSMLTDISVIFLGPSRWMS
jgi:hypothetical protein